MAGAIEQLAGLRALLTGLGVPDNAVRSLDRVLASVADAVAHGRKHRACVLLRVFVTRVQRYRQQGDLTSAQAAQLTSVGNRISNVRAC